MQAGFDQTKLAQWELWIEFRMPMWVEDENVGYARLEVSTAEEASQHAHAEVVAEDLEDPEDDDEDPVLPGSDRPSPRKSTQLRLFEAGDADEEEPEASQAPKRKKPKKHHLEMMIIMTLRQQQSVLRGLAFRKPHVSTQTMY